MRRAVVTAIVMLSALLAGVSNGNDPKRGNGLQKAQGEVAAVTQGLAASNLQVLPRDTSYADVVVLMTRYSQELGVQCVFCHTQNPQTQQIDFASDEAPAKLTARIMIGMVRDINDKYLAQVSDRRYAVPIRCGNCHQGQTFPPAFEPKAQP